MPKPFYRTESIYESKLFESARHTPLFRDLCIPETNFNVLQKDQIVPELPRESDDDPQATRLIIIDTDTKIARIAFDVDRLSNKLDIDLMLSKFNGLDIDLVFIKLMFDLYTTIGRIQTQSTSPHAELNSVEFDLLLSLIAIAFSDPLDIVFYLHTGQKGAVDQGVKYCRIMAIKPRLRN